MSASETDYDDYDEEYDTSYTGDLLSDAFSSDESTIVLEEESVKQMIALLKLKRGMLVQRKTAETLASSVLVEEERPAPKGKKARKPKSKAADRKPTPAKERPSEEAISAVFQRLYSVPRTDTSTQTVCPSAAPRRAMSQPKQRTDTTLVRRVQELEGKVEQLKKALRAAKQQAELSRDVTAGLREHRSRLMGKLEEESAAKDEAVSQLEAVHQRLDYAESRVSELSHTLKAERAQHDAEVGDMKARWKKTRTRMLAQLARPRAAGQSVGVQAQLLEATVTPDIALPTPIPPPPQRSERGHTVVPDPTPELQGDGCLLSSLAEDGSDASPRSSRRFSEDGPEPSTLPTLPKLSGSLDYTITPTRGVQTIRSLRGSGRSCRADTMSHHRSDDEDSLAGTLPAEDQAGPMRPADLDAIKQSTVEDLNGKNPIAPFFKDLEQYSSSSFSVLGSAARDAVRAATAAALQLDVKCLAEIEPRRDGKNSPLSLAVTHALQAVDADDIATILGLAEPMAAVRDQYVSDAQHLVLLAVLKHLCVRRTTAMLDPASRLFAALKAGLLGPLDADQPPSMFLEGASAEHMPQLLTIACLCSATFGDEHLTDALFTQTMLRVSAIVTRAHVDLETSPLLPVLALLCRSYTQAPVAEALRFPVSPVALTLLQCSVTAASARASAAVCLTLANSLLQFSAGLADTAGLIESKLSPAVSAVSSAVTRVLRLVLDKAPRAAWTPALTRQIAGVVSRSGPGLERLAQAWAMGLAALQGDSLSALEAMELTRALETCARINIDGWEGIPALRLCPSCGQLSFRLGEDGCKISTCQKANGGCGTSFCHCCLKLKAECEEGHHKAPCDIAPTQTVS
ncbi:Chromosome partition protein Smc [Carpediemonas membranifera]|uniref:Chromosome partition protein Smc n=1 Tax=Carpediemonas membranifera TaxID=201153 RepID=A0A8J6BBH6_9EUKA|nr:Chromosome partition protein Smc [Carpediemonas membranifera]|eukprot:KAG9397289.1 Chromosome partition protein Smc [Carpediemonas membranifera]